MAIFQLYSYICGTTTVEIIIWQSIAHLEYMLSGAFLHNSIIPCPITLPRLYTQAKMYNLARAEGSRLVYCCQTS